MRGEFGVGAAAGDLEELSEGDEFADPSLGGVEDVGELAADASGRGGLGEGVGVEEAHVVAGGEQAAG
ncbi:hypothetical protein ABZZ20_29120 [Streptomyces sp. NPDC006430]|uniref:hypothetical protein n=1 Tax=Streptomyces sp. NPDC006430 TaxID=3154299 RepID=UPI0033B812E5